MVFRIGSVKTPELVVDEAIIPSILLGMMIRMVRL